MPRYDAPGRLARLLLLVVSLGSAVWMLLGTYAVGLDFRGGAVVGFEVAPGHPPGRALERAEAVLSGFALPVNVSRRGERELVAELDGAAASDVLRIQETLTFVDFQIRGACDEAWPPTGWELPAGVDVVRNGGVNTIEAERRTTLSTAIDALLEAKPLRSGSAVAYASESGRARAYCVDKAPIATGADVGSAQAGLAGGRPTVELEFTDEAGERVFHYTTENIGSSLAFLLEGEVVLAAAVSGPLGHDGISLNLVPPSTMATADELAADLRAAAIGLRVLRSDVVAPTYPPSLGRPVAVGLGAAGAAAWLVLLVWRRARWPWAAIATLTTAAAGAEWTYLVLGGTLTVATHVGAAALGACAAVTVAAAAGRGLTTELGPRLVAAWPGAVAFACLWVAPRLVGEDAGFWRGLRFVVSSGVWGAVFIALCGVVALQASGELAPVRTTAE